MNSQEFIATEGRLDQQIALHTEYSRSQIAKWIEAGLVTVSGTVQHKASFKPKAGETVAFGIPEQTQSNILPEDVPLEIIYQDEFLIAVNKPPGMTTHPSGNVVSGTLVNALLSKINLPQQDEEFGKEGYRPGIVHRLDKDTSGVIVVAKTVLAHAKLATAFKERQVQKSYLALCAGALGNSKTISITASIGRNPVERKSMMVGGTNARDAETHFQILARHQSPEGAKYSVALAKPHTGRTHQIRVHTLALKSPVVADVVYGKASEYIPRQALHALGLVIPHPHTGEWLHLYAPVPQDMQQAWLSISGQELTDIVPTTT